MAVWKFFILTYLFYLWNTILSSVAHTPLVEVLMKDVTLGLSGLIQR